MKFAFEENFKTQIDTKKAVFSFNRMDSESYKSKGETQNHTR